VWRRLIFLYSLEFWEDTVLLTQIIFLGSISIRAELRQTEFWGIPWESVRWDGDAWIGESHRLRVYLLLRIIFLLRRYKRSRQIYSLRWLEPGWLGSLFLHRLISIGSFWTREIMLLVTKLRNIWLSICPRLNGLLGCLPLMHFHDANRLFRNKSLSTYHWSFLLHLSKWLVLFRNKVANTTEPVLKMSHNSRARTVFTSPLNLKLTQINNQLYHVPTQKKSNQLTSRFRFFDRLQVKKFRFPNGSQILSRVYGLVYIIVQFRKSSFKFDSRSQPHGFCIITNHICEAVLKFQSFPTVTFEISAFWKGFKAFPAAKVFGLLSVAKSSSS
jgi:hypothetical protein